MQDVIELLQFITQTMGSELAELRATKLGGNTIAITATKGDIA